MAMTQRENVLEVLNWGNPEFVPLFYDCDPYFFATPTLRDQPFGGPDAFGVNWVATPEGVIPEPNRYLFDDVTEWREHLTMPDPYEIDYEACAAQEVADFDRENMLLNIFYPGGVFDRLVACMGFEKTLIALAEEPEACTDFFNELTDYHVAVLEATIDAYKPDMITFVEDMAHSNGLFMSPETYRELIKPHTARIVKAVRDKGVIFNMHSCGKCEDVIEDIVEIGVQVWNCAYPANDIVGIQKKYHGKLVVEGGWDTNGPASYNGSTVEETMAETQRCLREYGPQKGFILAPVIMNERGNALIVGDPRLDAVREAWPEISRIY